MIDRSRVSWFLRAKARAAGRQYELARHAYVDARNSVLTGDVPREDDGRVRIVCRRYAERRAVALDDQSRPECFEADHPDCQGCLEDLRDGTIETW